VTMPTPRWIYFKTTLLTLGASLWLPMQALAANTASSWRSTYDVVMMWVNFAILLALLFKFLRPPLGRFLKSQQDAIQETLDRLENEKCRLQDEVQGLRGSLTARKEKAEDWHQRIMQRARMERREIIETGRQEAERRLAKAHQLIEARHRETCQTLRNEMIDTAIEIATQEFAKHMTPAIEQTLTDHFLKSVAGRQP
jgi:F-type H+-transporting ATPase subunit b